MTRNADEKSVRIFLVYPGLPSPRSFSIFDNFFKFSNDICAMFKRKFLKNPLSRQNKGKEFLDSTFSNLSRILKIDANDVINKTFRCPLEKSCTISPSKLKSSFLS